MERLLFLGLGLAKRVVVPPTCLFALAAIGYLLRHRMPRTGRGLMLGSALTMWLLCLPWVASALAISLQGEPYLRPHQVPEDAQAIVILGADVQGYSPDLGRPDVGPMTLRRLRYGGLLARRSGLPVAVTGGATVENVPALGTLMARVLEEEQGVTAAFVETISLSTWENATLTAPLLLEAGIERIVLVSHAWHLPRARRAFEREGLQVIPAPTAALGWPDGILRGCVPSASSLRSSCFAIHEWIGRVWYRLRALSG